LRKYRDFSGFQDGDRRHFEFSKIRNFNGRSTVRGKCASPSQVLSKSVKRLQKSGNLTVIKMAAVHRLGFVKFKLFNGQTVAEISRFL